MVAELYDSGELHKELGIDFEPISDGYHSAQASPVTKPPSLLARLGGEDERQPKRRRRSRSLSPGEVNEYDSEGSAWKAADEGARGESDSEDDGRYGVESARKRRKKESAGDIIWISDESEEEPAPEKGLSISGASRRAEKARSRKVSATEAAERDRIDRRREFWRSKGPAVDSGSAD